MASLLSRLRDDGFIVARNSDRVLVAPRDRLTDQHRTTIREHKSELLADLDAESHTPDEPHRTELLRMLESRPDIKRAFIAEPQGNGAGLVRLAVRDIGTCDLVIPAGRFDPFAIMRLFDELDKGSGVAN